MIALFAVTLYAAVGIVIATAFLAFGVTRVLPAPAAVTLGARIMLFPGAVALWPYVLIRWLKSVAMTRSQRSVHRLLWPVLAFAVALGFAMALTLRPPPNVEAPGAAGELRP
jgi:hypothetical protein